MAENTAERRGKVDVDLDRTGVVWRSIVGGRQPVPRAVKGKEEEEVLCDDAVTLSNNSIPIKVS